MFAVILAQFSSKGFSDGAEGIVRVAEANGKLRASLFAGVVYAKLCCVSQTTVTDKQSVDLYCPPRLQPFSY